MIIDSHAHYAYPMFDGEFSYLSEQDGNYTVCSAKLEALLAEMRDQGIVGFIEPSIGFDEIEKQLTLVSAHRDFMWASIGVHPTRCARTDWKNRKKLKEYAQRENVIAIGESGLDYHYARYQRTVKEQKRPLQKKWFVYQIRLAHRLKLPLVLHIREADADALKILKRYRKKLHGGVVHCFSGDHVLAEEYIALGFAVGIGGKLLCAENEQALSDTVKNVPLSSLVIETDAPFVLPDLEEEVCKSKKKRKLCNSSLILPSLIRKIADLRGESYEKIETELFQNTARVFGFTQFPMR